MALSHGNLPIVTDGLILYYDVGNPRSYPGTGTTLTDLSANNFNGTLSNGIEYDSANFGSLDFTGPFFVINSNTQLDPIAYGLFADSTSFWTVSSWFLPDITNTVSGIIAGKANSLTNGTFMVYAQESNLRVRLRGGTILDITTSLTETWNEVAITWDGTTAKSHLNGSYVADISVGTSTKQNINFTIGEIDDLSSSRYVGKIAQTKVYNKALNSTEIQQNYNAIKYRYGL
jgi:hypothetical protein